MGITPQELELLMHEVEQEDPIDFADLPFDEHDLRKLVADQNARGLYCHSQSSDRRSGDERRTASR